MTANKSSKVNAGARKRGARASKYSVETTHFANGSAAAEKLRAKLKYEGSHARVHVIGRLQVNYAIAKHCAVDAIADRLASGSLRNLDAEKFRPREAVVRKLRNAVIEAHRSGLVAIHLTNWRNPHNRVRAAKAALDELCCLITDPFFLPAIRAAAEIVDNEGDGDSLRRLAVELDAVGVLRKIIADAVEKSPPKKKRGTPGNPYIRDLVATLVNEWKAITGHRPSRKPANRGTASPRAVFHEFLAFSLDDLSITDHKTRDAAQGAIAEAIMLPAKK